MINMKVAYFNKVGKIEEHGLIYRYIFASVDPHVYFSAHVIPHETTYDIFAVPHTNNLDNSTAVKLDDNNMFSMKGVQYGQEISIILGNDDIEGMSDFVEASINIMEIPVAIMGETPDFDTSLYLDKFLVHLFEAQLFKLSNIINIEIISNITTIKDLAKIDGERAVDSFIFTLLVNSRIFKDYLPSGLSISGDEAYTLYSKILYGNAYSSNIAEVFADMIIFFRIAVDRDIDLSNMPVEILATLMSRWAKDKSSQYIDKLEQASNEVPVEMMIDLNPVTISSQTKLFQVLSEIQTFVYIDALDVYIDDVLVSHHVFDPKYFDLLYRDVDMCRVERGIEVGQGVNFIITYGYGQGCDEFIGMNLEDIENSLYYGINKKFTLVNDRVENAVVYQNGGDSIAMLDGNLDSNLNMKFVLSGI